MRYLITGGLGYVGSWVARRLARQGHQIFILSRKGQKPDIGEPYSLIQADICSGSPEELASLLPFGLDGCVHAASFNEANTPGYAEKALHINGLGTLNLLEALLLQSKRAGTPPPTILYCSTFHVYGSDSGTITETTPVAPRNHYALTHLLGEEYCRMFQRTHNLPTIVVRLTNGYGTPLIQPFGKWYLLLNDLCRQAILEHMVTLRSNPATLRDFVWLEDVANTMEHLLLRHDLSGEIFNIASGQSISIGDMANLAASVAEKILERPITVKMLTTQEPTKPLTVSRNKLDHTLNLPFHNRMALEMEATMRLLLDSNQTQ